MLSHKLYASLEESCKAKKLSTGSVILESVELGNNKITPLPILPPLEVFAELSKFVPRSLRKRLAAGQHEWLSEFRPLTVLFISLEGLVCNSQSNLQSVQNAVMTIQTILYHYGGNLRQFTMDDKGPLVMALFGLPMHTHEDDAVRCIKAALDIHEKLDTIQLNCNCGITTGHAFCGIVGSDLRSEYAVVANAANLAARIMESTNWIACDRETFQAASKKLSFEELTPLRLKGYSEPVAVYRPIPAEKTNLLLGGSLVGREAEIKTLDRQLVMLSSTGSGSQVLVEGEPGIGKSHLLEHVRWLARENNLRVLNGVGDSIDKKTPYRIWRQVFAQLFQIEKSFSVEQIAHRIADYFADAEQLTRLLPLLNSVIKSQLPDNEITSQMRGDVRARNTIEFLVKILEQEASREPLVIVLDDCQWIDATSWSMIAEICEKVDAVSAILAFRPMLDQGNSVLDLLAKKPATQIIQLGELSQDEVASLLSQSLGIEEVPRAVAVAVHEHSEGNAFYSQELGYSLLDAGVIKIEGNKCVVTEELDHFEFPATVEKVVNGRVDALIPEYQLTLRIASVIGRIFELQSLSHIHPIEADRGKLPDYLSSLADLNFTPLHNPPPDQSNIFKHAIIHEVLYSQLLSSQRVSLHQLLAKWIERQHTAHLERYSATLAHHWKSAENPNKAMHYFRLASENTLKEGAYAEAVHFLIEHSPAWLNQNK